MLKVKDTGIDIEEYSVGYVRVSTAEDRQKLGYEAQKRIIADNNVDKIYAEKISGRKDDRPEFKKAIRKCKILAEQGKKVTFVVIKMDRISRKMNSLLDILEDLENSNVSFKSINENIDTSSATGNLLMRLMAMFSQFEVDTLRERTREALRQAKLDGKVLGRPAYDSKIRNNVERLYRNPDISIKDVAKKAGVSTRTVNRIAKERNLSRLFIKGTSFLE